MRLFLFDRGFFFGGLRFMREAILSPKFQMSSTNVLVVDDDNAVCRIASWMLSREQYQVQTANLSPMLSEPSNGSVLMSTCWTTNCRTVQDSMLRADSVERERSSDHSYVGMGRKFRRIESGEGD
jgi:hypothetical protein